MDREERRKIAADTLNIIGQGYYIYENQQVKLCCSKSEMENVIMYCPDRVEEIAKKGAKKHNQIDFQTNDCEYMVVNMDSYEANRKYALDGKTLVLNFANARHVGGGFLNGANAQEESLCRCSSLFASINSKAAKDYYRYNDEKWIQLESDYMMISPNVDVFRDENCNLMSDNFITAVLTMPAPNLRGRAAGVDKKKLAETMKDKIRKLLCVAEAEEYDTLVLGAWGCGAFGHDAMDVAGYFKTVLKDEGYDALFRKIIFAVYDTSESKYNYQSFAVTFK